MRKLPSDWRSTRSHVQHQPASLRPFPGSLAEGIPVSPFFLPELLLLREGPRDGDSHTLLSPRLKISCREATSERMSRYNTKAGCNACPLPAVSGGTGEPAGDPQNGLVVLKVQPARAATNLPPTPLLTLNLRSVFLLPLPQPRGKGRCFG